MTAAQLRALIPVGWRAALDGNLPETELERLARALSDERRVVLPARDQWFRALDETPLSDARAVILGQDPYPTQGQAEGCTQPAARPTPSNRTSCSARIEVQIRPAEHSECLQ
jgi:uracil DNA glycosylase